MVDNNTPKHPIYSHDSPVYVVTTEDDDKLALLREAITVSNFLKHLDEQWRLSGKSKEDYLIAIKPNIMTASQYEHNSPVYTCPELVEELIAIMRETGFSHFSVVESRNVYDYSYTGRTVHAVAGMCGYTQEGYTIADLSKDTVLFDYGGVLGKHEAGRVWLGADYRISFAKNKTHWQCFYTACIKNVYGCLPQWDKMKHYHGRNIEFFQAAVLIADKIPVHFGFMDAWTSGDGFSGHVRDARPNQTKTIFASDNIYALDIVAGWKMNIDPQKNFVIQEAEKLWGSITPNLIGDKSPWSPWQNVNPLAVKLLDLLEERYWLSRFSSRLLASEQDKRFPPVKRWQWMFGPLQSIIRFLSRLFGL